MSRTRSTRCAVTSRSRAGGRADVLQHPGLSRGSETEVAQRPVRYLPAAFIAALQGSWGDIEPIEPPHLPRPRSGGTAGGPRASWLHASR